MATHRKPLLAGNWKMNTTLREGLNLILDIHDGLATIPAKEKKLVDVLICPPYITLKKACEIIDHEILLGAQNVFWQEKGAFTGEISPCMLQDLVDYVIIGHSERRQFFQETDESVNKKIKACLAYDLHPILCIGEPLDIRQANKQKTYVTQQVQQGLVQIQKSDASKLTLAYEPIWAIGTGQAASAQQAQEIIVEIRKTLSAIFSEKLSQEIRILYGGSTDANNIEGFLNQPDIDGALIGGASLKAEIFIDMVKKTINVEKEKLNI